MLLPLERGVYRQRLYREAAWAEARHEGVCTGSKFGGPSCPPGSRRYSFGSDI